VRSIVIAVVGIAVIIAGAWGAVVLIAQKADTPVPLRYYAIVIGMRPPRKDELRTQEAA